MTAAFRLLTIQEMANVLRVHRATVSRMLDYGELPCVLVRSRKLIRLLDVQRFIDNQIEMTGESSREN